MAYNITGLADYTKSEGKILITDVLLSGQSFDILPVQEGVKFKDKLIDFSDGETVIQDGDYTGTDNYSGSTKLNDVEISTKELWVKESYKTNDLQSKITQMAMKAGSNPDDLPFKDVIMNLKTEAIASKNEMLLWQGDTNSTGTTYLRKFDGFLTQIQAATGSTVKTGSAAVALTSSNAISKVEAIVEKFQDTFPQFIDKPMALFMSPKNFSTYYRQVNKLSSQIDNNTSNIGVVKSFQIPGTNVTAYSIGGMTGNNNLILTRPENFVISVDLKGEDEKLTFEWMNESMVWRLFGLYKLGCKIARTNEIVVTGV